MIISQSEQLFWKECVLESFCESCVFAAHQSALPTFCSVSCSCQQGADCSKQLLMPSFAPSIPSSFQFTWLKSFSFCLEDVAFYDRRQSLPTLFPILFLRLAVAAC